MSNIVDDLNGPAFCVSLNDLFNLLLLFVPLDWDKVVLYKSGDVTLRSGDTRFFEPNPLNQYVFLSSGDSKLMLRLELITW